MRFDWYNKRNGYGKNYSFTTELFRPQLCDFSYKGENYQAEFSNSGSLKITNWNERVTYAYSLHSSKRSDAERCIRAFLNGDQSYRFRYEVDDF